MGVGDTGTGSQTRGTGSQVPHTGTQQLGPAVWRQTAAAPPGPTRGRGPAACSRARAGSLGSGRRFSALDDVAPSRRDIANYGAKPDCCQCAQGPWGDIGRGRGSPRARQSSSASMMRVWAAKAASAAQPPAIAPPMAPTAVAVGSACAGTSRRSQRLQIR